MAGTSRDIQRRIKSVESIGKVTRAMEAVSASKMRRAQDATMRSRAYAAKASELMAHLRAQPGTAANLHPLLSEHPTGRPAVVLLTPDRGLTGGLVLNIIRFAVQHSRQMPEPPAWITVGKKGRDFIARTGSSLVAEFTGMPDKPTVLDVSPVANLIREGFLGSEFSEVHIAYAQFESISRQTVTWRRLLPIEVPEHNAPLRADFEFEPGPAEVLDHLLPRLLEMRLYQALLESQASEHSARMVAMRNATEASVELVEDLTLTYNKVRQSDITSEILDIAGGAEALRQSRRS